MAVKLTERTIALLECEPGQRDRLLFDTVQRGLVVRVVAAGSKSYLAQYGAAGQTRRVPLGSVDAISLATARTAAARVMGQVAMGTDPAADRKAAAESAKVAAARERMTLAQLVADWERLHLVHRSARYRMDTTTTMKRHLGDWWGRPAGQLERRDVVAIVDRVTPAVGRSLAGYGRACFAWAGRRGSVSGNPFLELPVAPSNVQRDRVLTDAEVAAVWYAAGDCAAPYGAIVRLLLLTGQRRDEVRGMAWPELSDDLSVWTIPGARTKNNKPSVVPLPALARAIVRERLEAMRGTRRGLVYPGEGGRVLFGNWSKSKLAIDELAGVTGWCLHDLRRTVATGLQRLGVRLEVTEAVLNHVSGTRGGIVGIYQRHDWAVEKRTALEGWAAHLEAAVARVEAGPEVVPMRRSKPNAA